MHDTTRPTNESQSRILAIDDELSIRELLDYGLRHAKFDVRTAPNGGAALTIIDEWPPHAIILDIMLPGIDGIALLPALRRLTDAPILMLSARTAAHEKVRGLELGADDYITKPFNMDELIARINSALRRPRLEIREELSYADLVMNVGRRSVTRGGRPIELSRREFDLLETFMRTPERTLGRRDLLQSVWGTDRFITTTIVDTYVSYLRAKIDAGSETTLIRTIRGAGYALRGSLR